MAMLSLFSAAVLAGCGNTENNDGSESVAESVQSSVSESTDNSTADESNSSSEQEDSEDNDGFPSISIVTESDIEEQSWFEHTPSEDVVEKLKYIDKKTDPNGYHNFTLNGAKSIAYGVCRDKNVTQEQYDNVILYMDEARLNNEPISERKMAKLIGEDYHGERLTVELVKKIIHDVYAKTDSMTDKYLAIRRTIRNYMEPDYIDYNTSYPGSSYTYYTDDSKNKVIEIACGEIYYDEYDNDGNNTLSETLYTTSNDDGTSRLTDDELYEKYLNYQTKGGQIHCPPHLLIGLKNMKIEKHLLTISMLSLLCTILYYFLPPHRKPLCIFRQARYEFFRAFLYTRHGDSLINIIKIKNNLVTFQSY